MIPMLQRTQKVLGFLPPKALIFIAEFIGMPQAKVFGAATFYAQFRFDPPGRHTIKICRGTACHVRGSDRIQEDIQTRLKVKAGETTSDRCFSLETVACFGSCALAPVVVLDESVHGRMTPFKTRKVLQRTVEKEEGASAKKENSPKPGGS
ncbi:NADH dehydrogenase subunit E [Dethiosulfatarculus sandiegensis]|uniref:NADH dehydrogenase subunit E n=1 Tax=Dethiosulfatarculus sandiegensis TaxID=1429043 RepID=A0A0D2JMW4_9BACT|nr:NADH dehydrogenase subunit E [Dethiosulfatarculus sandiegensis]